ncbi:MAG TPA: hypothetical protein VKD08_01215 [Ignavibacteriaceae bacterium]|nr:hypothetical protein [Ignavibacteriaceae bacterium]
MKNFFNSRWGKLGSLLVLLVSVTFIISSCSDLINEPTVQDQTVTQDQGALTKDNPEIRAVIPIQERHTADLMKIPEVIGTAVGLTDDGKPCILVLTKTDIVANALAQGTASPLPDMLENVPVKIMVTGEIKTFKGRPGGGGVSHTAKQTAPISLGTSGGWHYDLANGYCCGGTLGSLVKIGSVQYIMSNYHVFESDIVSGGNGRVASNGDGILQPGLIDINCSAANGQDVATLVLKHSLPNSNVDVGVAQVISGMVKTDGSILEVGTLSANTVSASINQAVKKSGRTSGLTRSTISGLNATVSVSYENECAGGTAFTKTFTGQIVIANRRSGFLAAGDSGSLMVEDVTSNPRAVGLLFAGSNTSAIANPINQVLSFLGASMVGQ